MHCFRNLLIFKVKGEPGKGRAIHTIVTFIGSPCWGFVQVFRFLSLRALPSVTHRLCVKHSVEKLKKRFFGLGMPTWSASFLYLVICGFFQNNSDAVFLPWICRV